MKVFKFYSEDYHWAYSGETEEESKNLLFEEVGEINIDKIEEIPDTHWDDEIISIWEDNDMSTEPFKVSIRSMISDYPQQIFTNDVDSF